MSGRNLFAVLAMLLFIAAVTVYIQRGDSRIVVKELHEQPKIRLVQYEYYRVKDDVVTSRIVGKDGQLMDGGMVILRDGVRAVRLRDGKREELSGNYAEIELAGSSPGQLSTTTTAKKARIAENVELIVNGARMESEEVTYTDETSTIRSTKPVRIERDGQLMTSDAGFDFVTKTESLRMYGGVRGIVLPKAISASQKKDKPQEKRP